MSIEQINKKDIWNPCFYKAFPGFASILPVWQLMEQNTQNDWPFIDTYNDLAKMCFEESLECKVEFQIQQPYMRYETYVNLKRIVPTRPYSWHDFFNNLSWLTWPRMKSAIVKRACQESDKAQVKERTSLQNTLAHFDECGVVICSDNLEIFEMIRLFEWKKLFFETQNLISHCIPIIVGHGLLEKALNPYIGLTAKAIFLQVDKDFFQKDMQSQNKFIDQEMAKYILSATFPNSPQALHPFPILGWPQWHQDNHDENFYKNTAYFRTGRRMNKEM
ncbi:MAG: DUF3025 domain-containing protein [Gammaproteobacteria bacterium]|jgi:hypothetical protein|nr:DUF3025 domain-containing protein [Gammaproteobacteria bacterium]